MLGIITGQGSLRVEPQDREAWRQVNGRFDEVLDGDFERGAYGRKIHQDATDRGNLKRSRNHIKKKKRL